MVRKMSSVASEPVVGVERVRGVVKGGREVEVVVRVENEEVGGKTRGSL